MHIASSPTTPTWPGTQVYALVPLRRTFMLPLSSMSATVACAATAAGAAESARAILVAVDSSAFAAEGVAETINNNAPNKNPSFFKLKLPSTCEQAAKGSSRKTGTILGRRKRRGNGNENRGTPAP